MPEHVMQQTQQMHIKEPFLEPEDVLDAGAGFREHYRAFSSGFLEPEATPELLPFDMPGLDEQRFIAINDRPLGSWLVQGLEDAEREIHGDTEAVLQQRSRRVAGHRRASAPLEAPSSSSDDSAAGRSSSSSEESVWDVSHILHSGQRDFPVVDRHFMKSAKPVLKSKRVVHQQFPPNACPPPAPRNPYWKKYHPTMTVPASSVEAPSDIMNHLLSFFREVVVASVLRVSHVKFVIKAQVFVGDLVCTVKVRMFIQEDYRFALEWAKYEGDSLASSRTYEEALDCLHRRFRDVRPFPPERRTLVGSTCLDDLRWQNSRSHEERKACFEEQVRRHEWMAEQVQAPHMQLEYACMLAVGAQDLDLARLLCDSAILARVLLLLQSGRTEVEYHTALLLTYLSRCEEACPMLISSGLLQLMVNKVVSRSTSELVQKHLAQALNHFVVVAGLRLPQSSPCILELIQDLQDISAVEDPSARQTLEDTRAMLLQVC